MKLTHCFFAGLLVTSVACDADDGLESHTQSLVEAQGEQEASLQRLADAIGEEEAEDLVDERIQEEFDALTESELAADASDETELPADPVFSATPDTQAAPMTCESSHWP